MDLSAQASANANQKTVVLVEDESVILELLRAKLQSAGMRTLTAMDGVSGLKLIREEKPDLVLLDMLLPGMNGLRVLEALKADGLLPALPVLIISNSGQPVELDRALALGARDYLIKVNFDPHEVLERAQAILAAEAPAHAPDPPPRGARVLIVEDDILLVSLLERKFAASGYAVERALDADAARRLLTAGSFAIILLDLVLPGTDGFSFLGELKRNERAKNIPVVIISNLGQQEEIARGMRMGATDYIVKANASPAEIVAKIGALINNKSK